MPIGKDTGGLKPGGRVRGDEFLGMWGGAMLRPGAAPGGNLGCEEAAIRGCPNIEANEDAAADVGGVLIVGGGAAPAGGRFLWMAGLELLGIALLFKSEAPGKAAAAF